MLPLTKRQRGDPRLPQRFHPAARLRAEPRGESAGGSACRRSRRCTSTSPTCRKRASSSARGTAADRSSWCRRASAAARSSCRCSATSPPARRSKPSSATRRSPCPRISSASATPTCCACKGDSMIDEQIRDGDYVIVEDRRTADNGEMVIALLNGSDVTLKKLYREHGRIRLQPANPAMQPIIVPADQVQVQGVVIGVMRRYSSRQPRIRMSERKQINFTIVPDDAGDSRDLRELLRDLAYAVRLHLCRSAKSCRSPRRTSTRRSPSTSSARRYLPDCRLPLQMVPNLIAALQGTSAWPLSEQARPGTRARSTKPANIFPAMRVWEGMTGTAIAAERDRRPAGRRFRAAIEEHAERITRRQHPARRLAATAADDVPIDAGRLQAGRHVQSVPGGADTKRRGWCGRIARDHGGRSPSRKRGATTIADAAPGPSSSESALLTRSIIWQALQRLPALRDHRALRDRRRDDSGDCQAARRRRRGRRCVGTSRSAGASWLLPSTGG